jgi:hypothetical protein
MRYYNLSHDPKFKDVEYAKGTDWEKVVCPVNDGHQRAGDRIGDLRINIIDKKRSEFLWTFFSECIISDKTANLFKSAGFSGFQLKPVQVRSKPVFEALWEFIVVGKGGEAHPDSGIFLKDECVHCGHIQYSAFENGIIVEEKNWDGSDFFTVTGYPRYVLVTSRVKELILREGLRNVRLTLANELKWPKYVIKP